MQGYCSTCGEAVTLAEVPDAGPATERGIWLRLACACGTVAYIRERDLELVDLRAWSEAAARKRGKSGGDGRDASPRAHWLSS